MKYNKIQSLNMKNEKVRPLTRMVNTCIRYANSIHINKTPPNVLLNYIVDKIERINKINDDSYPLGYKEECISKCWECYNEVQSRMNESEDESWSNATSDGKGHWKPKVAINFYGDKFEESVNYLSNNNDYDD